ncbi:MAG: ferritin-like domain-containing protein [Nannocystaceae bacterium]
MTPAATIRSAILLALALPSTSCGERYEDEKCLDLLSDGTCPSSRDALLAIRRKDCDGRTISVNGKPTVEDRDDFGGGDGETGTSATREMCCYPVTRRHTQDSCPVPGRPFLAEGTLRLAPVRSGDGWRDDLHPVIEHLTASQRRELADAWLDIARGEHAAIAAFARLSLELLQLGAPAELLEASQAAGLDEVRHAKGAFALACVYAGRHLEPGPLDLRGMPLTSTPATLGRAAAGEGCRDETLSALLAIETARTSRDPAVRSFLRKVAADETRHAAFSWRLLQWTLQAAPGIVRDVDETLLVPSREKPTPRGWSDEDHVLEAHGIWSPRKVAMIRTRGHREIVGPCWRQLRAA